MMQFDYQRLLLLSVFVTVSATAAASAPPVRRRPKRVPNVQRAALFGYIEEEQLLHNGGNFGRVLDAGTGLHSLRWMQTVLLDERGMNSDPEGVRITSFVGITADPTMQRKVEQEARKLQVPYGKGGGTNNNNSKNEFLIGNWFPSKDQDTGDAGDTDADAENERNNTIADLSAYFIQKGETFDTILVDYLIGAMDAFSPYTQDMLLPMLAQLLTPSTGRLYLIGMEPVPDVLPSDASNLFCKVTRVRDAMIKLGTLQGDADDTPTHHRQHRPYREYPLSWIQRQLASRETYLREIASKKWYLNYVHHNIMNQLNVARYNLKFIPTAYTRNTNDGNTDHTKNNTTRVAMEALLKDLEQESKALTEHAKNKMVSSHSFDYIIVAERISKYEEWKLNYITSTTSSTTNYILELVVGVVVFCNMVLIVTYIILPKMKSNPPKHSSDDHSNNISNKENKNKHKNKKKSS